MMIDVHIVGPEGFPREDLLVWFEQRNIAYDVRPWHRGKCVTLNRCIVEFLGGTAFVPIGSKKGGKNLVTLTFRSETGATEFLLIRA